MAAYTHFDPNNPPPPLLTSEPDSFAQKTLAGRKPAIIRQVLADFEGKYPAKIIERLNALLAEIEEQQPITPLKPDAPDEELWAAAFEPHAGKSWFDVPWYFAETFFYRRLLEAVNYFGVDEALSSWQGVDPFLPRKTEELAGDSPWQVLTAGLAHANDNTDGSFWAALHYNIWSNRIDLSYNQVAEEIGREIAIEEEKQNLLVDDSAAVMQYILRLTTQQQLRHTRRVDFICDNSGSELLLDLALADYFLCFGWINKITLHLKHYPFFVSDAMVADVQLTLDAISAHSESELVADLGHRLNKYLAEGRLILRDDIFWNSSKFFWDLPDDLRAELTQAQLVVIKGDANYRRLLGDSRWPTTTPLADAVPYFPAPFVCLRTMKSDPVVGLTEGQAEALNEEDPQWRVNGKRGVIQALL